MDEIKYDNVREYNAFVNAMLNGDYQVRKLSTMAGYISRKLVAVVSNYSGRYGDGYIVHKPRFDTTGFHDIYYLTKVNKVNNADSCVK